MPDRILRDEILDSERWLSVDCNAKLAFIACLLKCDCMGNLDAQPIRLHRLWRDFGAGSIEQSEAILKALQSADLCRIYAVDNRRFVHIPRFGQRLRYVGNLHPKSPWDKINHAENQSVAKKSPGASQVPARRAPAEVKRSEVNLNHGLPNPGIARARAATTETEKKIPTEKPKTGDNNFSKPKPNPETDLPREWWRDDQTTDSAGRILQLPAKAGESYADYRTRLFALIATRNRGTATPAEPAAAAPSAPPRVRQPPEQILQGILDAAKNQHRST